MNRYRFENARHIHFLDGNPLIGSTSSFDILKGPPLWWASGMACEKFGFLYPPKEFNVEQKEESAQIMLEKIKGMTIGDYLLLLDQAYKAHNKRKEDTADAGADMHEKLEDYVRSCMKAGRVLDVDPINDAIILPFAEWAKANVKEFLWAEMHCYSERLYTGGIIDLGYRDMQGFNVLGDYKSSKEAYLKHAYQTAGYEIQLKENGGFDPVGNKIFPSGIEIKYHAIFCQRAGLDNPYFNYGQIEACKRAFEACVEIYKIQKNWGGFQQ